MAASEMARSRGWRQLVRRLQGERSTAKAAGVTGGDWVSDSGCGREGNEQRICRWRAGLVGRRLVRRGWRGSTGYAGAEGGAARPAERPARERATCAIVAVAGRKRYAPFIDAIRGSGCVSSACILCGVWCVAFVCVEGAGGAWLAGESSGVGALWCGRVPSVDRAAAGVACPCAARAALAVSGLSLGATTVTRTV